MKIKERIAASLDGPGVEKPAKLAIPEEETDTRYAGSSKDALLRMLVELYIKTIEFRQREQRDQDERDPPADIPKLVPLFSDDPVHDKSGADRQQHVRSFCHQRRGRQRRPRQQMQPGSYRPVSRRPGGLYPRSLIEM